jgi:arylsulfatase
MEQREHGFDVWAEPMMTLRFPKIMNLRRDPFERAFKESNFYHGWWVNHFFLTVPTQTFVREWIASFEEFPVRQKPAAFNLERVLESMERAASRN